MLPGSCPGKLQPRAHHGLQDSVKHVPCGEALPDPRLGLSRESMFTSIRHGLTNASPIGPPRWLVQTDLGHSAWLLTRC